MTYQLKDQTTGFFDPETGLKVVRDQCVEPERIGRATAAAIQAGRLIAVGAQPRKPAPRGRANSRTAQNQEGK